MGPSCVLPYRARHLSSGNTASPPPQRPAALLVARCAEDPHEKAPPVSGAKLPCWSCLALQGLPISSGGQQAHHPNAEPHQRLHSARGTRTKKPRRSGASWVHHGLPKCGAISVAPSPQRPPSSSILAGAATFWSRYGDALGVGGKPLPFGAARGQSWATSSTTFCCSPVWHYSSRGLSSRPRACSSDAAPLLSDAPRAVRAST